MQFLSSFSALSEAFDAFILDLWGVIHDGQRLYPGVMDCLKQLRAQGKKIVLLSNAPRRAQAVAEIMIRMGIGAELYDAIITSGETGYQCLADPASPVFRSGGNAYVYIGLEKDRNILNGLAYHQTDNPDTAHFLLLSHPFYDNQPEAELLPLLERCINASLTALCINPDKEVVRQTGERVYCAGVIAEKYEAIGGRVIYFGKPHPLVYQASLKVLEGIKPSRILAVGDNLATDILGANRACLASALVTGGVLKDSIGASESADYEMKLAMLLTKAGAEPDYILPAFNW